MSSVKRKFFVVTILLLSVLMFCIYSKYRISRQSVVTAVQSYTHSGLLRSVEVRSGLVNVSQSKMLKYVSVTSKNNSGLITGSYNDRNLDLYINYTESQGLVNDNDSTHDDDQKSVSTKEGTTQDEASKGLSRNETDSKHSRTTNNKLQSLSLEPLPSIKPGCRSTGQNLEEESKRSWLNFKSTLETYATFHREQLQQLKAGNRTVRTLTWSCHDPVKCSGIGDQFYKIQEALIYAITFKRVLTLHWNAATYETTKYLRPNRIDWTYFNRSQGMYENHNVEFNKIKMMKTAQQFESFYKLLAGESHTHVTVTYELPVPFLRGMSMAVKNPGMRAAMKRCGFTDVIMDKNGRLSMNFLSGKLLRYLFHFSGSVVDTVDWVQQQLGIDDKPYLAVHIRTGFLGMEQEEVGNFNSHKIYRHSTDWKQTLACSVNLAHKLFGSEPSIFLATDSDIVKALAVEEYGKRFVMVNVTLQHVAYTKKETTASELKEDTIIKTFHNTSSASTPTQGMNPILKIDGVDGYMATWMEFLLLARASAMVHSISGFSTTAAQYCSMHNQYHLPNCKN